MSGQGKKKFLAFNFWHQKLEVENIFFSLALFCISNLQSMKLKLKNNIVFLSFGLQLLAPKVEGKVERFLFFWFFNVSFYLRFFESMHFEFLMNFFWLNICIL